MPCYDCRAPLEFRFASGVYRKGLHADEPIPMKQTGVGKLAFLTSRRHDMAEEDRVIIACFRVDGVGPYPELKGNAVWADEGSPYALRVPPERLHEAPRFWESRKRDKQTRWGTGLFRYIPDDEARAMWDAVAALGSPTTNVAVRDWIEAHYPGTNLGTIQCQITICTVNQPSRVHYPQGRRPRDCMASG